MFSGNKLGLCKKSQSQSWSRCLSFALFSHRLYMAVLPPSGKYDELIFKMVLTQLQLSK